MDPLIAEINLKQVTDICTLNTDPFHIKLGKRTSRVHLSSSPANMPINASQRHLHSPDFATKFPCVSNTILIQFGRPGLHRQHDGNGWNSKID